MKNTTNTTKLERWRPLIRSKTVMNIPGNNNVVSAQ